MLMLRKYNLIYSDAPVEIVDRLLGYCLRDCGSGVQFLTKNEMTDVFNLVKSFLALFCLEGSTLKEGERKNVTFALLFNNTTEITRRYGAYTSASWL